MAGSTAVSSTTGTPTHPGAQAPAVNTTPFGTCPVRTRHLANVWPPQTRDRPRSLGGRSATPLRWRRLACPAEARRRVSEHSGHLSRTEGGRVRLIEGVARRVLRAHGPRSMPSLPVGLGVTRIALRTTFVVFGFEECGEFVLGDLAVFVGIGILEALPA